ncbi:MAG: GntR family transcriptional regulator [Thermodesulfobacteriota bacterium]
MRVVSITDMVRHQLEQAIFTGKIKPGTQLKEEKIAEDLEISRPPIRETFKTLEAEGLVIRKPRRGVFVAELKERDAWEIYTLKAELYQLSIELSFDELNRSDLDRMAELVQAMEACVRADPPNIASYQEVNEAFHDVHVEAAGHGRLKKMIGTLHNQIKYYSSLSLTNPAHLEGSFRYHVEIMKSFQAGDKEGAIRWTRDHVLAGLNRIRDLTAREPSGSPSRRAGEDGESGLEISWVREEG